MFLRYLGDAPRINEGVDPEVLKSMGNEAYRQGRFAEALALYDRAITLDSIMSTYDCNKSAALFGFERLQQPLLECEEAIRLQPSYARAHSRLATIYCRLEEAEKALNRNKKVPYVDYEIAFQGQALQDNLDKCIEAWKVSDWKLYCNILRCGFSSTGYWSTEEAFRSDEEEEETRRGGNCLP